jgi:hypothetical protein
MIMTTSKAKEVSSTSSISDVTMKESEKGWYKHYSSYPEHKNTVAVRFLPGRYIARKNRLNPLRRGQYGTHSQSERAGE